MKDFKIIIAGIVFIIIGGYLFWVKWKQLKATEERNMLWASRLDVFMSAFIMIICGVLVIVLKVIKLLKG